MGSLSCDGKCIQDLCIGGTLAQITKGTHMNELEKILNKSDNPKLAETEKTKQAEKPTPAANKANAIIAQGKAIAAASTGSPVFRSAATFLAASLEVRGLKK